MISYPIAMFFIDDNLYQINSSFSTFLFIIFLYGYLKLLFTINHDIFALTNNMFSLKAIKFAYLEIIL